VYYSTATLSSLRVLPPELSVASGWAVADVAEDRVVQQRGILRRHRDLGAQACVTA